ncbi:MULTISPECIES: HTTM domain-containing protein [unclassified Rhodococcus (in: high G+C Gram-positive bacteria)]|uniref:HTTM domain-containing protein n=1 Tax=unclassified Rhodococcus (in: high G+C Gram-positive bacteria) TaxID=192944 RepID=UPI0012F6B061|nr:HTTM domain-containing protein [Rhodococcus sp. DK17]
MNIIGGKSATQLIECVDRLSDAYRAGPTYLGVVRILFALYVIARPVDYEWAGKVPAAFFQPAPGPFSWLDHAPAPAFLLGLEITRLVLAVALLIGYRTVGVSFAMAIVLVTGSGIANSFGKVDHFILFEILPFAMAAAGWGAALSLDAHRAKNSHRARPISRGLPILMWAMTVAFALFTAALPKAISGWLDPSREATRGFVARDIVDPTKVGPLTSRVFQIDSEWFWKLLDYATIVAEGWLIVLVLFPVLFRIGIAIILVFHLGVYLTLGIEFDSYLFVYLPFFSAPAMWLVNRITGSLLRGAPESTSVAAVDRRSSNPPGSQESYSI